MSNSSQTKIAFLFGSGISIPAGMPSTQKITERVLSGKGVMRDGVGNYFFHTLSSQPDESVSRVIKFLHRLKVEIDYYYEKHKIRWDANYSVNYEDLYYMATQIYHSEVCEYGNSAVEPLVDKILPYTQPLLEKTSTRYEWEFRQLAEETIRYIQCVVCLLLTEERKSLNYLNCVKDACQDNQVCKVDIFTLNQDTILEEYFEQNNIQFTDGFNKEPEAINELIFRRWNPNLFNEPFRVRLFKLHGSVDWRWFYHKDWENELIGIPLSPAPWHIEDKSGQKSKVNNGLIFLVGTFNKMLEYTSGIYADLNYQLYRSLHHTKNLIISGYGFGDRGINNKIREWISPSNNHRIILIDPNPESVRNRDRGFITDKWDDWIGKGKLIVIRNGIEETSWYEITKHLCFQ